MTGSSEPSAAIRCASRASPGVSVVSVQEVKASLRTLIVLSLHDRVLLVAFAMQHGHRIKAFLPAILASKPST